MLEPSVNAALTAITDFLECQEAVAHHVSAIWQEAWAMNVTLKPANAIVDLDQPAETVLNVLPNGTSTWDRFACVSQKKFVLERKSCEFLQPKQNHRNFISEII